MPSTKALPVEFLATSYLGEKGQLTIPKQYRDSLTLKTGAPLAALRLGNGLLLIPEEERFRKLCDRLATVFARHEVMADDLLAALPAARAHVFAELYPELAEPKTTPAKVRRKTGRKRR